MVKKLRRGEKRQTRPAKNGEGKRKPGRIAPIEIETASNHHKPNGIEKSTDDSSSERIRNKQPGMQTSRNLYGHNVEIVKSIKALPGRSLEPYPMEPRSQTVE